VGRSGKCSSLDAREGRNELEWEGMKKNGIE